MKSSYKTNVRNHNYTSKTFIRPDTCNNCQKKYEPFCFNHLRISGKLNRFVNCRIKFGTSGLRCRNCRVQLHINCESDFNIACVPHSAGTPNAKGLAGAIVDYAPSEAPMVPAIIVHCINEVIIRKVLGHSGYTSGYDIMTVLSCNDLFSFADRKTWTQ